MPDIVLFACTLGFLSGVFYGFDQSVGIAFGIPLLVGIIYFGRREVTEFSSKNGAIIVAIFLTSLLGGIIRFNLSMVAPTEYFRSKINHSIEISGRITNDPVSVEGKTAAIFYSGRIGLRVSIKTTQNLHYNDLITIKGTLSEPENFLTDQGTEFDYVTYLKKDHILFLINDAKLISVEYDKSFSITRLLYDFRHTVEAKLFKYLPKQEAGFVAGILLGTKTSIDESLYNDLVRTSTVHVIALSGYNVSIVAEGITATLGSFLTRSLTLILGGFGIILFVIMTGASSTALRAGLMAIVVILSRMSGRSAHIFRVMSLAALGLVLYNPMYLVADASFQLSFLATLGLVLVSPTYVRWLGKRMPEALADMVGTTLAAKTAVAPYILYKMGLFSVIALPVNLMIIPFIPYLMLLGFLLICISFVAALTIPALGAALGYPVYLLAAFIIGIITTAARIPFASVTVPHIPFTLILLGYVIITWHFTLRILTDIK